jgi:hypothetical protein
MQGMRELLRSLLGKSLGALAPVDKLAAAWPVACGRSMAEHGAVTSYADGRVVIEVTDATWLQQMLAMRSQLTSELRRIAGVELREIHFQRNGASRSGESTPRPMPSMAKPAGANRRR